jgi:hypothetical protein
MKPIVIESSLTLCECSRTLEDRSDMETIETLSYQVLSAASTRDSEASPSKALSRSSRPQ